jgi:hypothetical protein
MSTSCSVQKKLYNRGWHIENLFQLKKQNNDADITHQRKSSIKRLNNLLKSNTTIIFDLDTISKSHSKDTFNPFTHTFDSSINTANNTPNIAIIKTSKKQFNKKPSTEKYTTKPTKKKINKNGFISLGLGGIFGVLGFLTFRMGGLTAFLLSVPLFLLMYLFFTIGILVIFKSYIKKKAIKTSRKELIKKFKNIFKINKEAPLSKWSTRGVIVGMIGLLFQIIFNFAFLLDWFGLIFSLISLIKTIPGKRAGLGLSILGILIFLISSLLAINSYLILFGLYP